MPKTNNRYYSTSYSPYGSSSTRKFRKESNRIRQEKNLQNRRFQK